MPNPQTPTLDAVDAAIADMRSRLVDLSAPTADVAAAATALTGLEDLRMRLEVDAGCERINRPLFELWADVLAPVVAFIADADDAHIAQDLILTRPGPEDGADDTRLLRAADWNRMVDTLVTDTSNYADRPAPRGAGAVRP